jgi:voltage-gated potassium channel
MTPSTETSRWFTVLMILSGMLFVPWQVGKLVKVFVSMEKGKNKVTCGSCGLVGHDEDASHCKACGSIIFQEYEAE